MAAPYYYAGGRKVELELDREHVAVPRKVAQRLGVELPAGRELPGDLALVRRDALSEQETKSLEGAGALRTVYGYRGALLVPLPEVRVEVDGDEQAVRAAIAGARVAAEVEESAPGQLVVRPKSELGDDALSLANEIMERANPALSSARMVQVVPHPGVPARRRV